MTALAIGAEVAVIGAGSSGLAVLKALRVQGVAAVCFEWGSEVGGLWRYETTTGFPGHASRRTNASRLRMQYPSFPMPASHGDEPTISIDVGDAAFSRTFVRTTR